MRNYGNTRRVEADKVRTSLVRHWGSDLAITVDLNEISGLPKAQNSETLVGELRKLSSDSR